MAGLAWTILHAHPLWQETRENALGSVFLLGQFVVPADLHPAA